MRYLLAVVGVATGIWLVQGALWGVLLYTTQGDLCTGTLAQLKVALDHGLPASDLCIRESVIYRALWVEAIVGVVAFGVAGRWLISRVMLLVKSRRNSRKQTSSAGLA
jgi:hypothetical protein